MLSTCDDWASCSLQGGVNVNTTLCSDGTLQCLWDNDTHPPLEWDCDMRSLRLAHEVPLFRKQTNMPLVDIHRRRGAGRDRDGNWYWIDDDESSIRCLRSGSYQSVLYWSANVPDTLTEGSVSTAGEERTFAPLPPRRQEAPRQRLRGLTVTTRNYLVVGDSTNHGLLLFDLYNGGNPTLQRWPEGVAFAPWDMAATPDGGLLILDRVHNRYWRLDCHLRLAADLRGNEEATFQPLQDGQGQQRKHRRISPHGYGLTKEDGITPLSAISIEMGPDGHVLVLETELPMDPQLAASTIYEYDGARLLHVYHLSEEQNRVEIMDPSVGEGIIELYAVVAADFAYVEDGGVAAQVPNGCNCIDTSGSAAGMRHMLYLTDIRGKQAFGFRIDSQRERLLDERAFLPLRRWGNKGIVSVDGQVYYDFRSVPGAKQHDERWVPLMIFSECHYTTLAVLYTPTNFITAGGDGEQGMGLIESSEESPAQHGSNGRSRQRGKQLIAVEKPATPPAVPGGPFDSNIGGCAWHRLLLDAQIPVGTEISIRARASDDPQLLHYTAWIDQPSLYLRSGGAELPYYDPWHDLRDPKQPQMPLPDYTGTWEILFQRITGRYLQLELTISGGGRATPAIRALRAWYPRFSYLEHYLPAIYSEDPLWSPFFERWLANFEGLYTNLEDKIEHVAELFDPRAAPAEGLEWLACWFGLVLDPQWDEQRRRLLIRHIDQLYRRRGTLYGIEIAARLYLDPVVTNSLFDPNCLGTGTVRIVEQFLTRDTGGLVYGDPGSARTSAGGTAYRFSVLVPHDLDDEQLDMVRRIVELEKPAHTDFSLGRYWDYFNVGTARLGQDTSLGESRLATQQSLGESYLGDTHLDIPYPQNLPDRIVFGRDDLGQLSAL
jgi:phage tail-like protein